MAAQTTSTMPGAAARPMVRVWDPFVRVFHWTVVVTFFVAYTTEDDLLTLHVWAGYLLGGLLVVRLPWGFLGPEHARFADFIYRPGTVLSYFKDLIGFRAKRYLGHSPAGGAMIVGLMLGAAATVWSGLEFYAIEEGRGPLAGLRPAVTATADAGSIQLADSEEKDEDEEEKGEERRGAGEGDDFWEDIHEALAHATFVLVILHVGGVVLASIAHRENLVRSMVTGRKRPED